MATTKSLKRPLEVDDSYEKKIRVNISDENENIQEKVSLCVDGRLNKVDTPVKTGSKPVCETDVGITEYISKSAGFFCVIKERYSDFLVNEIDLDGNVVKLTNVDKPKEVILDCDETVISKDKVEELEKLIESGVKTDTVCIDVTDETKDARKNIHNFIKKCFPSLDSKTETSGSSKSIVVSSGSNDPRRQFNSSNGMGNYTHFVLYKENKDTMTAIDDISSILRIPSKKLSYAGTKDKRAKTVQAVSAFKVEPNKLLGLNKRPHPFKVGNISFRDKELKLGDLRGNRFIIVLRQCDAELNLVGEAVDSLSSHGFINYYGMQRFGTRSVATHHIGRELLRNNWRAAIELVLQPQPEDETNYCAGAQKVWMETGDAKLALTHLRQKNSIEGHLLRGLAHHNQNDLVNALNYIPRNSRLMYIHSYQSYIWNKVVSRRIQKYGLKVLPGDLIVAKSDEEVSEVESDENKTKCSPTYVSEEDIQSKDLIHRVVLPLPGHSISYPNNETKSWYLEFLQEDGMNLDNFVSKVKSYSLSGSYRKMIVKPTDVKWEMVSYDSFEDTLVLSDWDILQKTELTSPKDGKFKALKLELSLPSSAYATMAIREISKADTSVSAQKSKSHL